MSVTEYGVLKGRQTTNTERWLAFAALFLFGFTASCNLFKSAPVMSVLGEQLGLDPGMLGLIMTFYSIAALVFAPIGALVMRKTGVKFMVVASCAIMVVGTAISWASGNNATIFLTGRAIEGVAYGLICVCGPNILPRLFPRKQMGLAVGIWSQWIPCGTIIAFFTAPLLFEATGTWQGIWMATLILGIIALVLLLLLVKMPAKNENTIVAGNDKVEAKHGQQFFGAGVAVCAIFIIWVYCYVVNINQMYPTFLQEVKGLSIFDSSMLPNWLAIITIPLGIIAGVISDKYPIRKKMLVICYAIVAVIYFFLAFTPGTDMTGPWAFCIIMGICASFIPTYTRGITPLLCTDGFKCDMALMVMALVTGIAQCLAFVDSMTIASIGWFANAQYVCAPLMVLAAVLTAIFVKDDKVVTEIREREEAEALKNAGETISLPENAGKEAVGTLEPSGHPAEAL